MVTNLKYLVLDVDGTLTDGGIYYDEKGNELKKFNTRDAAGIFAIKKIGVKIIIMTGRECYATVRRMEELKVDYIFQNVKNKASFLLDFMKTNKIEKEELGYIGDDLNDYESMKLAGFKACPNDACKEIKKISDYISSVNAGHGAVRDIIENIMEEENLWEETINNIYNMGT